MIMDILNSHEVECPFRYKKKDFCDIYKRRKKERWKCGECANDEYELTGRVTVYLKETVAEYNGMYVKG